MISDEANYAVVLPKTPKLNILSVGKNLGICQKVSESVKNRQPPASVRRSKFF